MKSPTIALIRQRYTAFGGAERFVARAMEALGEQGAELTIVTRQWQPDSTQRALICNPFYLGSLWRDWSFARCVCHALEGQSFDLVQSHERIPCCDLYRAGDGVHREWLKQRSRTLGPLEKIGVALNPYHHYVLAAEQKLFQSPRLKAVICNSHMVKAEIQDYFGVPEHKLHVIYSGVDSNTFHPDLKAEHRTAIRQQYGIPPEAPLFLFVGSGFERKGLRVLLEAMARFPAAGHLIVVGRDKRLARFRSLAAKHGLAGRVHFVGGQQDVRPFYGAADVFVLPTLYDPFPNVTLEAFACGLPVITSTKSGAAELVRAGENGFVCDALDRDKLLAFMVKSAQFEPGKITAAARNTVAALPPETMARQLLALYQNLI